MGVCLAVCELREVLCFNRFRVDLNTGFDFCIYRKLMFAKEFSC